VNGFGSLIDLEQILLLTLLMARAGGVVLTAPFLSGQLVPRTVKVLFVGALALVMIPLAPELAVPSAFSTLVMMLVGEVAVGLALGFVSQLFIVAFHAAGELIGHQMGFGMARIMDPMQGSEATVMGRWFWLVGMTFFFVLGGPALVIRGLAISLELVPPGLAAPGADVAQLLVELSAGAFSLALGIAAPAVGILLLTSMSLGILTRTVPQMNVFIVGFPLKITAGIVGVALTLPFLVDLARREIGELAQRLAAVAAGA